MSPTAYGPDPTTAALVSRKDRAATAASSHDDQHLQTSHPQAPITAQRPVPTDLDKIIPNPGCPRAVDAPSIDNPTGATDNKKSKGTPLMQHVEYFDLNKDGTISPAETFRGFRKIGFNIPFSIMAVFVIHGGFAYFSQDSWIPDPRFLINVRNIHKCKHGSDMEGYDTEGRFVPQKMEEIFTKYDKEKKGYLTFKDVIAATEANRNALDFFGWWAAKFEWVTLWLLCQQDGKISREDVRSCYDGSLFYRMEQRNEQRKLEKAAAKRDTRSAAANAVRVHSHGQ